ncbi:MAG: pilus assembly protein PilM [Nevskia sp.]|jgi:type IV pilus assembly protein PilM|nr:pilus assembly protein PilM [Gammaproteobacteria bacterium]MDH4458628.1 pilus assembly protein PilM [Nevskia sp.]
MSIKQSLFGKASRELIGLDISSSAVKLLELARRGDRYSVESFAIEQLPHGAVTDRQITDPKAVAEVITRAINRAGTRNRQAAVAVAGSSVITKVIAMSAALSDNDMEEQIKAEADQYIPYPIDEVNLDFQVLGPSARDRESVDVLLAACRKEQVESRIAALEIAGLTPLVVDIEAYALENVCELLTHQMPANGVGKTVAVVDVGASTTSLLVLHDLQSVYTRDQAYGGRQLTEDIMRFYGMSYEEAGKAKRLGNLPANYESEVLNHFIADMAQQIDRSLQFFFAAASRHNVIDQLILGGGCAHIPGIDVAIQKRLQIPCVIAQPFAKMNIGNRAKPAQLGQDQASLLIAAGLALRAFDVVN